MSLRQSMAITAATAMTAATLGLTAAPARAFTFGTGGIQFDQDTRVDFSFIESHGGYTSSLSIFKVLGSNVLEEAATLFAETKSADNSAANEWQGTCGNTVPNCTASFLFQKGVTYTLGLSSGWAGTVYSTTALNPANWNPSNQQAVFGSNLHWGTGVDGKISRYGTINLANVASYTSANPFSGPVTIAFDDTGNNNDRDFNDFVITAQASSTSVPEPATLAGLGVVGAGLLAARRRQLAK